MKETYDYFHEIFVRSQGIFVEVVYNFFFFFCGEFSQSKDIHKEILKIIRTPTFLLYQPRSKNEQECFPHIYTLP